MQVGFNQTPAVTSLNKLNGGTLNAAMLKGISQSISPFINNEAEQSILQQLARTWADPVSLMTNDKQMEKSGLLQLYSATLASYDPEQILQSISGIGPPTAKPLFEKALAN